MRRNEILKNRKALTKVGCNRSFNDGTRRLRHQTTHTRQLAHLLGGTPSTGIGHHEDRVKARNGLLDPGCVQYRIFGDARHQLLGNLLGGLSPDIDHLVISLTISDQTFLVLIMNLRDFFSRLREEPGFVGRDDHIIEADGNPSASRVAVTQRPQSIR